jgi:hypothetical protein
MIHIANRPYRKFLIIFASSNYALNRSHLTKAKLLTSANSLLRFFSSRSTEGTGSSLNNVLHLLINEVYNPKAVVLVSIMTRR